jgi:membrane protein implicated in regulation of membrane protease activity
MVDPMAVGFTVTGLALLVCLGLAAATIGVQLAFGAGDTGFGTMFYWLLAGLTAWATLLALAVVTLFAAVRWVRRWKARATEEDRR